MRPASSLPLWLWWRLWLLWLWWRLRLRRYLDSLALLRVLLLNLGAVVRLLRLWQRCQRLRLRRHD